MTPFKKIIIAYDFSSGSRPAITKGLKLARFFGAKPIILHVIDTEIADVYKHILSAELTTEIEKAIKEDLATLDQDHLEHDIIVTSGKPAQVIAKMAEEQNANLVVIGSHGHNIVSRVLLGSTSESVLKHSPVPVFVARHEAKTRDANILVPIDLDPASEQAIPMALTLSRVWQSQIKLMHVVELVPHLSYGEFGQLVTSQIEQQKNALHELAKKHHITTDPIVMEGKPAHCIVHLCEENQDIGLVIMTTHHRSGLEHFLMGSVTETTARYLDVDLLALPHTKKAQSQ